MRAEPCVLCVPCSTHPGCTGGEWLFLDKHSRAVRAAPSHTDALGHRTRSAAALSSRLSALKAQARWAVVSHVGHLSVMSRKAGGSGLPWLPGHLSLVWYQASWCTRFLSPGCCNSGRSCLGLQSRLRVKDGKSHTGSPREVAPAG